MKIKKLLTLASMALVAFSSCSKDEDDDSTTPTQGELSQEMLIDGTPYELGDGFIFSYGQNAFHQGTNLDLNIVTSGINIIYDASGYPDSATGSGYIFYLEMYSPDSTFISPGTYTMDTVDFGNLFTISNGSTFSYNTTNEVEYDFVSGSVEVSRSNNVSTFEGTFTEEGGKEIKFSYQKDITVLDDN